jgi:3'-phosphoadenosine 5'-phosphosulfate sulfotransferase (PAPS reductase)/FAD synthetase
MKRFISFSGGVESTTMCILYGKGATALWVDTGAEHQELYERIDYVEKRIKEIHNGDFELIRLKGKGRYKGEDYENLEDMIVAQKFMPSGQKRYCTYYFKIKPIDDFLGSVGECELLIGFNYDEQGRTGNLEMKSNVKYAYPLIEDGLTRDDCEDVLKVNSLHPDFPVYMLRGGCRMCFFKSEKEYRAMYHLNRKEFDEVANFEKRIQDNRKKFYSIMGTGKSLEQLAKECKNELFSNPADMYDKYKKEAVSCGAFCRR